MTIIQDINGNDVELKEGDLFAFNTPKTKVSTLIRIATSGFHFRKGISHVAPLGFDTADLENGTLELKALSAEKEGIKYRYITEMIKEAKESNTTMYHIPLLEWVRELFDFGLYQAMGSELNGKPYGWLQYFLAVAIDEKHIDWLSNIIFLKGWVIKALKRSFYNDPTMLRAVCSSVTAKQYIVALENYLKKFPEQLNPNEQSPIDTTSWKIYKMYNVITGKDKGIHKFNTMDIMAGVITGI